MFWYKKKELDTQYIHQEQALAFDALSKRYGVLPSDLLKSEINDLEFNIIVCSIAVKREVEIQKKEEQKHKIR